MAVNSYANTIHSNIGLTSILKNLSQKEVVA